MLRMLYRSLSYAFLLFVVLVAIGKEIEKYIKKGALVPDSIIEDMIIKEMKGMQKDNWLLDGTRYLVIIHQPTIDSRCYT